MQAQLPLLIAIVACAGVSADGGRLSRPAPLPRVSVLQGKFVVGPQARPCRPLGFQYIRIRPEGPHYVCSPSYYDPVAVEAMFSDIERNGCNLVRIFVGGLELVEGGRLSSRFMANVCDFLERATAHRIHVLVEIGDLAGADSYAGIRQAGSEEIQRTGHPWLDTAWVTAQGAYIRDFIAAIKSRDPSLLSTVFAYEFKNEACIQMDQAPFKSRGSYMLRGVTYDLSSEAQIQALMDAGIVYAAGSLTEAVHTADPAAMTSYSAFTLRAVGRSGVARMLTDVTPDARVPVRPLALAKSALSYVDIHMYGPAPDALALDLRTCEWDELRAECGRRGKPILCGEFGTFPSVHPTEAAAAYAIGWYLRALLDAGFAGAVYWSYDCAEQKDVWNAKAGAGLIFQAVVAFAERAPEK